MSDKWQYMRAGTKGLWFHVGLCLGLSPTPIWRFSCGRDLVINKILNKGYYRLFPLKSLIFNKFV